MQFMTIRIYFLVLSALFIFEGQAARAQNKADRKLAKQLETDITYLASDELEGRCTSSAGELKAAEYIEKRYKQAKVGPYKGQYRYPFTFIYGKEVSPSTQIRIGNMAMRLKEDAFPLPFSASKHSSSDVLPDVMEQGNIWLIPLYADQDQADNPHFEWEKYMFDRSREAEKQGAAGVIFYDGFNGKYAPAFSPHLHSDYETLGIPVAFLKYSAYQKYIKPADAGNGTAISDRAGTGVPIDLNISINKAERTGNNIAAYIDNKASYTVILGAHYDHLGYGDDGNSLYANASSEHLVHHGADDNASGTAALLEMASRIKSKKLRHYNYLFVNFSGEELGLFGSKAFVKDQAIDSAHIAYMLNMDMVGRLNDSTHALTLGGVGTSPAWTRVVDLLNKDFKVAIDSSGVGPSDHTSFYNVGIPVLFVFTGTHKDYHKPSDKSELINYRGEVQVIRSIDKIASLLDKEHIKPVFTPTKQKSVGRTGFKVTLGIMPDYTFDNGGVRVDGVSDNRPAMKAGIKQGDIITQLGTNKITGMQTYMEALGKFKPGDKTEITVIRAGKEMSLPIELNK
jgi:aminopeptidase YwaD